MIRRSGFLLALLVLAGCTATQPAPVPKPRYLIGDAYQVGGVWQYPQASFSADQTGLATLAADHAGLTANGEAFDQTAMAASHRTLQLPAIVRVTNLQNGRQVTLRLNDRGPPALGRLIGLTRRAAELLQAGEGSRVRLQVMQAESQLVASELGGDGPALALAAAPRDAIGTENLAPPSGAGQSSRGRVAPAMAHPSSQPGAAIVVPARLPETVTQVSASPGLMFIDAGSFSRLDYASILANRLIRLGARVTTSYTAPRDRAYRVRIGPVFTVPEADRMLQRAIEAGVTDAAIIVE